MSACVKDDVSAEGHGSPFGLEEWRLMGSRAGARALLFMQSELAGDHSPSGGRVGGPKLSGNSGCEQLLRL